MSTHSLHKKKKREGHHVKSRTMEKHDEFLQRITKTLYYSKMPHTERFSLPLSELAVELYSEVKLGKSLERLRIEEAADISRNACISPCSLVLAVIYLEQLKTTNSVYVDKVAPSELFLISLMVASKFLNDNGEEDDVLNSEWAASANLTLSELNQLEKEFLNAIDWKLYVKDDEFWGMLRSLEAKVALKEGKKRGWFSYTELESLLDQINAFLLAQAVFTVSAVCLASYAAGMLTVIGSTIVATQLLYIPSQQISTAPLFDFCAWHGNSVPPDESDLIINGTFEHFSDVDFTCTVEHCSATDRPQKLIVPPARLDDAFMKENISEYDNNLFFSNVYYPFGFRQQWTKPALYLVSK